MAGPESTWRPPRPIFDLVLGSPTIGSPNKWTQASHISATCSSQVSPFHLWKTPAARNFFFWAEICISIPLHWLWFMAMGPPRSLSSLPRNSSSEMKVGLLSLELYLFQDMHLSSFSCYSSWSFWGLYYPEDLIRSFLSAHIPHSSLWQTARSPLFMILTP